MDVLVVEDSASDRELVTRALETWGYGVRTASNGQEATRILSSYSCRIIVSDWEMPAMDGIELCRWIRKECSAGYHYVILLTSHARQEEMIYALRAGADDFMTKPLNQAELLVRLRSAERLLSLDTRNLTIFTLAKLSEARDPETVGHLERVQGYSRVIAEDLAAHREFPEVDAQFINLISLTSPLHDIGKVGVPDHVLLKRGPLTPDEFELMKNHTLLGMRTLDAALRRFPEAEFLRMARDIVAAHHERFDGRGYPNRLIGNDIPLAARIVAVADVYDALTSDRPYKAAFPHGQAMAMIREESGRQFDPRIVDAMVRAEPQILHVQRTVNSLLAAGGSVPETTPSDTLADRVLSRQRGPRIAPLDLTSGVGVPPVSTLLDPV